ncbi:hypothetical protein BKA69DRAFT_506776 [Paraphysoderma sedebokerense]|nr:hypothetical protein BKA69DRAFT_506776 [Paraphysoderma sedebokerense]
MKPEITLSPNEIDRLLETEEKQKRLKRLQEVRIQEKQLSLQRVKQFKAEMKSEWENVVVSLERDFEIKKQQELEYLNTIYEGMVNEEVGKAFKDAEMERRMEVCNYILGFYRVSKNLNGSKDEDKVVWGYDGLID